MLESDVSRGGGQTTVAVGSGSTVVPHAQLNKRLIPFASGTFDVDDAEIHAALAQRPFALRIRDAIGQFGNTTKSESDARKDKSTKAESAVSKPSVQQLNVAAYRRYHFSSNRIQSARYTLLSFLPLNLWEQLTPWNKPANTYFLCVAILQSIRSISTTNGRPSILVPLLFVLTVTAIKDAIEDYHRAKSDRAKNDSVYIVWRPNKDGSGEGQWIKEYSKDLLVGDFVRIEENQRIPADILLVASGIDKGSHVFIDTKDLDGETNLKPKFVPNNIQKYLNSGSDDSTPPPPPQTNKEVEEEKSHGKSPPPMSPASSARADKNAFMLARLQKMSGELECDAPNGEMGEWHASLAIDMGNGKKQERQNLGLDALILSDCVLRNTPFAVGLVTYTGDESKLRTNMQKQLKSNRTKETTVFKLTKKLFAVMATLQFLLCISAGIACGILQAQVQEEAFYLSFSTSAGMAGFLQVWTWFILAKDFVPISLYVSMELVQFWQAAFMGLDKKMSVTVTKVKEREEEKDEHEEKDKDEPKKPAATKKSESNGKDTGAAKSKSGVKGSKDSDTDDTTDTEIETEIMYAKAQTSRLNEELAQVSYIFSDKTGTLTQNSMNFKKCVIGRRTYGTQSTEAGVIRRAKLEGKDVGEEMRKFEQQKEEFEAQRRRDGREKFPHVEFDQKEELLKELRKDDSGAAGKGNSSSSSTGDKSNSHSTEIREYLLALALNNAVFPKIDPLRSGPRDHTASAGSRKYDLSSPQSHAVMSLDSSSPDEKATCYFAQYAGFELFSRAGGRTRVRITDARGEKSFVEYAEIALLDFSPKRKRMTVLVEELIKEQPTGRIKIYCKGADSFVYPFLRGASESGPPTTADDMTVTAADSTTTGPKNWSYTYSNLVEFGGESLRTLVVCSGEKSREWWFGNEQDEGGLKELYEHAQRTQGESEKGHTDGSCSASCKMCAIESHIEAEAQMELLGATAIEDLLQDGVGAALKSLLDAEIHVWVLTGDNVSTAINIGISCNLLEADFERDGNLFKLDKEQSGSLGEISRILKEAEEHVRVTRARDPQANFGLALHSDAWKMLYTDLDELEAQQKEYEEMKKGKSKNSKRRSSTVIIPKSQSELQEQREVLQSFFHLTSSCRSVIACRLEPKEKAQIVEEMRRRTGKICLAIGDGNNDTPMIKQADIGVGIRGVEGTSAVASSDYAISQFRFLTRLLLGYGHLNYRRMSLLISYIFYKSSILVWTAYFLGAYSMYSGQSVYLDWTFQLYNVAYTALPILVVAVLDRDFEMDLLESHPLIYSCTRGSTYFNPWSIFRWLLAGLFDSAICFFIPWYSYNMAQTHENGQAPGFVATGLVVYTAVVLVVNFKLFFFVRSWTWLHVAAFLVSFITYWVATLIFNATSFFAIGGLDYAGVLSFVGLHSRFWLTLLLCVGSSVVINILYLSIWETFWPRTPVHVYYEAAKLHMDLNQVDSAYKELEAERTKQQAALQVSTGESTSPLSSKDRKRNQVGQSSPENPSGRVGGNINTDDEPIPFSPVPILPSTSNAGARASGSASIPFSPVPVSSTQLPPLTVRSPLPQDSSSPRAVKFHLQAGESNTPGDTVETYIAPAQSPIFRQPDPTKRVLSSLLPRSKSIEGAGGPLQSLPSDVTQMRLQHIPSVVNSSHPEPDHASVDLDRVLSLSRVASTPHRRFVQGPTAGSTSHSSRDHPDSTSSGSVPYTGFSFNHTPIGRLWSINHFEPVHEAHSIPDDLPGSPQ